jgi:hypothetical protein
MSRFLRRTALALIMTGMSMAVGAGTSASAASTTPLRGDVLGSFFFHACPADAPAGALCLHDDVAGQMIHLGRTTGSFEVVFDTAAFGADGCGPIRKQGSLVAANGERIDVSAEGTFCFGTLVALYEFRITGGTGRFANASGSGSWLVPAPTTFDGVSGTGDEFLLGALAN